MTEIYLYKRQLTPYERHKRSKDVLSIQSPNLAVLQSPLLDGEYEFGYFANIASDQEELDSCCTDIAAKFASEIISGNENCSFLQYGTIQEQLDGESIDISSAQSEVVVLSQIMQEVWNFIQLSSRFIQFDIQCSFTVMDDESTCIDLLTTQYCGFTSSCSKVHVFDFSALRATFQKGMIKFREMVDKDVLRNGSILMFTIYFSQRNVNTGFTRLSRYNHIIVVEPNNMNADTLMKLSSNLRNSLKKNECRCENYQHEQTTSPFFHFKSCPKCFLKSILRYSDCTRIMLSVSPSNLSSSFTLRVMQFGQYFAGLVGDNFKQQMNDKDGDAHIEVLQNVQLLKQKLLDSDEISIKLSEKLKLRKIIDCLTSYAEGNCNISADERSENVILKNTVQAQYEKIKELEEKVTLLPPSTDNKSDDSYIKGALQVSLFRERQAVYYLRQFRRFYRRLLKHKAIQGDTNLQTLDDLNGIDGTLLNLGIIQQRDIDHDDAPILYESNDSRDLSKVAASDAFLRYLNLCNADDIDKSTDEYNLMIGHGQEQLLTELTVVTKKCTELQLENERLRNLELIENAPSSLIKKECMTLKTQLDQSREELNAVVWKLNELNTNNLLLSNQAHHTKELEDVVKELQTALRNLNNEKCKLESELRDNINSMSKKIEILTLPRLSISNYEKDSITASEKFYYPIYGEEVSFSLDENVSCDRNSTNHSNTESSIGISSSREIHVPKDSNNEKSEVDEIDVLTSSLVLKHEETQGKKRDPELTHSDDTNVETNNSCEAHALEAGTSSKVNAQVNANGEKCDSVIKCKKEIESLSKENADINIDLSYALSEENINKISHPSEKTNHEERPGIDTSPIKENTTADYQPMEVESSTPELDKRIISSPNGADVFTSPIESKCLDISSKYVYSKEETMPTDDDHLSTENVSQEPILSVKSAILDLEKKESFRNQSKRVDLQDITHNPKDRVLSVNMSQEQNKSDHLELERKLSLKHPTNEIIVEPSGASGANIDSMTSPLNLESGIDSSYLQGGRSAIEQPRKFAKKLSPTIKSGLTRTKPKRRIIHSSRISRDNNSS